VRTSKGSHVLQPDSATTTYHNSKGFTILLARLDITRGTQIFTLNSPSTSLSSLELGSLHLRPLEFTLNSALVGLAPLPPRSARQHSHMTHVTTAAVADAPTLPRQRQLSLAA
jgi:hypothetical protein